MVCLPPPPPPRAMFVVGWGIDGGSRIPSRPPSHRSRRGDRMMDGPDDDKTGSSLTYLEKWRNQYLFDFDIFLDPTLILI